MKPFLTRDEQIALMETVEVRQKALMARVLSDPLIRRVVSTPASLEDEKSAYEPSDRPRARCA